MVNNQKYKLKCQLSNQKQTPVYFPISEKETPKENKISLTQKEEIVNKFIVQDIILSVVFLCAAGVLYFYEDSFITSTVRHIFNLLTSHKSLAGLYVIFLVGGITIWLLFKNTSNFSEEMYTLFAILFLFSCILYNLFCLIIIFYSKTHLSSIRIQKVAPFILLVFKGIMFFYGWFLQ